MKMVAAGRESGGQSRCRVSWRAGRRVFRVFPEGKDGECLSKGPAKRNGGSCAGARVAWIGACRTGVFLGGLDSSKSGGMVVRLAGVGQRRSGQRFAACRYLVDPGKACAAGPRN